ncbi:MAG: dihydroneopterin aldolase [Alicyclobacillaceae bacterium]|nr:dihydroneopterin aldolase [Alicyclobacillaceae bacterium]
MDEIRLEGMEFYAYHGVIPEEQALGQRFVVDVALRLPLQKSGLSDDLRDTLDYSEVYLLIRDVVEGERHRLMETVAERIAQHILDRYPVDSVRVCVKKISPPFPGPLRGVAVDIERIRT